MSHPLFNFRLSKPGHRAIAKAAEELNCDRSALARMALSEFLGELQAEGLISQALPSSPRHWRHG
jgi:hypothetical protein